MNARPRPRRRHHQPSPIARWWPVAAVLAAFLVLVVQPVPATAGGAGTAGTEPEPLPKVLILGDSISIDYLPFVRAELAGIAEVIRPEAEDGGRYNCEGTTKGLAEIDNWLALSGDQPWAVIHFNFGLHDMKRIDPATGRDSRQPEHPRQAEPDVYANQLERLVERLRHSQPGAALIFATTTPVPDAPVSPHRDATDPPRYNAIAAAIMQRHEARVNDLFSAADANIEAWQRPANVHFTEPGSRGLGKQVAAHIRAALEAGAEP